MLVPQSVCGREIGLIMMVSWHFVFSSSSIDVKISFDVQHLVNRSFFQPLRHIECIPQPMFPSLLLLAQAQDTSIDRWGINSGVPRINIAEQRGGTRRRVRSLGSSRWCIYTSPPRCIRNEDWMFCYRSGLPCLGRNQHGEAAGALASHACAEETLCSWPRLILDFGTLDGFTQDPADELYA